MGQVAGSLKAIGLSWKIKDNPESCMDLWGLEDF